MTRSDQPEECGLINSRHPLGLNRVMFYSESLTVSLLSRLSNVTVLVLRKCRFEEFWDFVSFIRCFPLCEVLCLRGCTWTGRRDAKSEVRSLPAYDVAPVHLEITNNSVPEWGEEYCNQSEILGAASLDLACLKSFTYGVGAGLVLEKVAGCGLLEEIDVALPNSICCEFGECEPSSWSFGPELVVLIEISDCPVNPLRRSYQIPHHQV